MNLADRFPTLLIGLLAGLLVSACATTPTPPVSLTLTVIGSNDVHGELSARDGAGGLEIFAGFVQRIRDIRANDGGDVLLIDAGDMWQGTLDSNLNEGAAVVAAFNQMGYDAAAVGNHEFDFGPLGDDAIVTQPGDDPRGALKQRAREASFPLLAANLVDAETGETVDWINVQPSVALEKAGVTVGIIGVIARRGLAGTIAANVSDLRVTPLAAAIETEARRLRGAGAALVIVAAHAGGRCENFADPDDLSSCQADSEIFAVARALPKNLVDQIIAGHVHQGLAHRVNGITITSGFSNTTAFDRVDYQIDRQTGQVLGSRIFPPQAIEAGGTYEGQEIQPDAMVSAIALKARRSAMELQNRQIGVELAAPFTLDNSPDSALGNLFNRALHESLQPELVLQNVRGGLRTALPAGPLTYGRLFKTFPFDNRVVTLELSGAQLRQVLASQALKGEQAVGISGIRAQVSCTDGLLEIAISREDGRVVDDNDRLNVATSDYLALGGAGVLQGVMPEGGFAVDFAMPLVRDVVIQWLSQQPSPLNPAQFTTAAQQNWFRPEPIDPSCQPGEQLPQASQNSHSH